MRRLFYILAAFGCFLAISCREDDVVMYDAPSYCPDNSGRYGVRWSTTDPDDLGQRCFSAAGKSAMIGIGDKDGHSDFDNIYPWSEITRVTIGGDVFVRIPIFYVDRYVEDGYEYRVITQQGTTPHPAFIEDGKVLDAVYVGAYEGRVEDDGLHSVADVIPTSNYTPQEFLNLAEKRGEGYTLYDMRTVNMIFDLFAVEFGCRNSSKIFGYGISQYKQPIEDDWEPERIYYSKETVSDVNYFKGRMRKATRKIVPGSNICICKGSQDSVLTYAKVTSIEQSRSKDYTIYYFDGPAVDLDTDCFIGNCAQSTNWTETCSSPLKWHTGRANMKGDYDTDMRNPMRYRWIENIVGNLWHFLPDVTFKDLQMYVCDNMKDYQMHCYTGAYRPVGEPLPENNDLGRQIDKKNYNYWVTNLVNYSAAPWADFGCQYDKSLTSKQAFGAYYYLRDGVNIIANGGGFDHECRSNMLTNRAWIAPDKKWFLYGARLIYKDLK